MTTLDRLLREHVETMLKEARPEQIRKLLDDIARAEGPTEPTHKSTERLQ